MSLRPDRRGRRSVARSEAVAAPAADTRRPVPPDPPAGRPAARPPALDSLVPVPTYRDQPATVAADPSGTGLDGRPCRVPVLGTGRWTLLVFLSSTCHGCREIWEALDDAVGSGLTVDESVVVVTRDPGEEDAEAVRRLATGPVPVVMSTATWSAYRVQGPPFFALVDGRSGAGGAHAPHAPGPPPAGREQAAGDGGPVRVTTEGVAWSVAQVADDVRRARRRVRRTAGRA